MGQHGAGGYGGISTMNQDDRGAAKYGKHMSVVKYTAHPWVYVKCLLCGLEWRHEVGERGNFPAACPASEASDDA